MRSVLRNSTGISDYAIGARGPIPTGATGILVKVHARSKWMARTKALWLLPRHEFEGKYIYTYRDPRDAILSLYEMYKHRKGRPDLSQDEFIRFYDPIGQYRWEIRSWVLREHSDVLRVRFEDLKQDPALEFQRIFQYLGLRGEVHEESLGRAVANADQANRPRRAAYAWKAASAEYAPLLSLVTAGLEQEIRALGYDVPDREPNT